MQYKDKIFKPHHTLNIILLSVFLLTTIYLKYDGQFEDRIVYILAAGLGCLLIWEIFSLKRYSYLIRISKKKLHYKDDKIVIELKDIMSFTYIPTISYTPSKFILETKKGDITLELPNYNRIKLKRISETLTEHIKNLQE